MLPGIRGSSIAIGIIELALWTNYKLLVRVEELHQERRAHFSTLSAPELREFITRRCPALINAVQRVPAGDESEMVELGLVASVVPYPQNATKASQRYFSSLLNVDAWLIPRVLCQNFRDKIPITTVMLTACFDPQEMNNVVAERLRRDDKIYLQRSGLHALM
eukprot:SAG11_NODE_1937_length_4032_cov_6.541826_3_plen_163_part_00